MTIQTRMMELGYGGPSLKNQACKGIVLAMMRNTDYGTSSALNSGLSSLPKDSNIEVEVNAETANESETDEDEDDEGKDDEGVDNEGEDNEGKDDEGEDD